MTLLTFTSRALVTPLLFGLLLVSAEVQSEVVRHEGKLPSLESPSVSAPSGDAPIDSKAVKPKSPAAPAAIWEEGALAGDGHAMLRLAHAYLYGLDGATRDAGVAANWFERAAVAQEPLALLGHAYVLALGVGVPKNVGKARELLQRAEGLGYARAYYLHAQLEGQLIGPTQASRARALIGEAAERGDALAQNALGVNYERLGDRVTARLWYAKAIQGSQAARANLARLDKSGVADADDRLGLQLLRDQAAAGDSNAQFLLARRQHRGDGTPADYTQALLNYRLSAAQDYAPAKRMLQLILSKTGPYGQLDPQWMQQVANVDVGGAQGMAQVADATSAKLDVDPLIDLLQLKPAATD